MDSQFAETDPVVESQNQAINRMIEERKRFLSTFNVKKCTLTGKYVNEAGTPQWVYDVIISHNGTIIYVIGFSQNQKEGAPFAQGKTGRYCRQYLTSFKEMAIKYAIGEGVQI